MSRTGFGWKFKNFLYRVNNPRFWQQNEPTSWQWDKVLNELLDDHKVIVTGRNTCEIGDYTIWISNYPYSFGYVYNREDVLQMSVVLPAPLTRVRLGNAVKFAMFMKEAELNGMK